MNFGFRCLQALGIAENDAHYLIMLYRTLSFVGKPVQRLGHILLYGRLDKA